MKTKQLPLVLTLALAAMIFFTAAAPAPAYHPPFPFHLPEGGPKADFGDAPDSTNPAGAPFEAYPGVSGNFPTVYDITTGIPGPRHDNATLAFFLGADVSGEDNAEFGLDSDIDGNNLVITGTVAIAANNDGHDNGLTLPAQFPHCQQMSLQFTVTVPEFVPVGTGSTPTGVVTYANLWIDWDRSGDWGENAGSCPGSSTGVQEWAIENMQLDLPGPGTYSFTTPVFTVWNPDPDQAMWVRITLAEQMSSSEDGAGPAAGYIFGETEDYLWIEQNAVYLPIAMGGGGTTTPPPVDDDDTHVDESEPTEVQSEWPQIPDDGTSVVLDIDDLQLSFTNNSDSDKTVLFVVRVLGNGNKTEYLPTPPILVPPGGPITRTLPISLILPAVEFFRSPVMLIGETMVSDPANPGQHYSTEISYIAFHPHETNPFGQIVVYNDLGLERQMSAMQFDHNAALGASLSALIPPDYPTDFLSNLVMYEGTDEVVNESPEDPGEMTTFLRPAGVVKERSRSENQPGVESPDFTFILCLEWYTAPTDNGFGEDYGLNDGGWRARGAKVSVWQAGGAGEIFDGYLNQYGCTYLTTNSTAGILVYWWGEARLLSGDGGYITVRHLSVYANDSGDLTASSVWIDNVTSGEVYRPEMWNYDSMGMLAYAVQERFNGEVSGVTYYLKKAGCNDDPDKGSCATSMYGQSGIFMSSSQYRRKFILGHEYGHRVLASAANYTNDCSWGTSGHGMKGLEYGSCASMEGWGHFVAVDIWNGHTHGDSGNLNPDGIIVYWDGSNTVYSAEIDSDQAYCRQKFSTFYVCDFFGYEIDWMRQWWDYHTNPGDRPSHATLFDLIDETVWENDTFDAAQAIKDASGNSSGRWDSFVCWNGVAGDLYGCE